MVRRRKLEKQSQSSRDMYVPEEILMHILTRLPFGSVIRFKSVCKKWKSLIESLHFRHLFLTSNSNSTSSYWSILRDDIRLKEDSSWEELELSLPKESHGNTWPFESVFRKNIDQKSKIKEVRVVSCADGLVLLREECTDESICYYVGNPVLSQWTELPPPPPPLPISPDNRFHDCGLVTRMTNGVILSYKVVRLHKTRYGHNSIPLSFEIFSSDTGEWSHKQVSYHGNECEVGYLSSNPITLNGKLHWPANSPYIVVHDFFSDDGLADQARTIRLPDRMREFDPIHCNGECVSKGCKGPCYRVIFSVSQRYFVFIEAGVIPGKVGYNVRVWRLKYDSWEWELAWEIDMGSIWIGSRYCVPIAINNFDMDIIYLWDLKRKWFHACNVRTRTNYQGRSRCEDLADKETFLCYYPYSNLSHLVLSLQEVPKKIS